MRDRTLRALGLLSVLTSLAACGSEQPSLAGSGHEEHAALEAEHGEHAESAGSCEHHEQAAAPARSDGPQPSAVLADGARQFGGALTDRTETPLASIAAAPATFDGQTVRTAGRIERVCQRMGCWMELSAEGTQPVRVPMAGHSFFLPRDVAGHEATIEGRVLVTPLSPEVRAHLASEGAVATADELSIEATSVVVR